MCRCSSQTLFVRVSYESIVFVEQMVMGPSLIIFLLDCGGVGLHRSLAVRAPVVLRAVGLASVDQTIPIAGVVEHLGDVLASRPALAAVELLPGTGAPWL